MSNQEMQTIIQWQETGAWDNSVYYDSYRDTYRWAKNAPKTSENQIVSAEVEGARI